MARLASLVWSAALAATAGCCMCAQEHDHCGPTCESGHCCDQHAVGGRVGSVLAGGFYTPAAEQIVPGEPLPPGAYEGLPYEGDAPSGDAPTMPPEDYYQVPPDAPVQPSPGPADDRSTRWPPGSGTW